MLYRGYTITNNIYAPITGKWRAIRFGVSICAGTKKQLIEMINIRIKVNYDR